MEGIGKDAGSPVIKAKKKVDLASLDTIKACNDGAEIELRHPITNEPLGAFIKVLGKDSDTFREFQRHNFNEYLRNEALAKARGKRAVSKSADDLDDDMMTMLVGCTVGWRDVEYNGEPLVFSAANVRKLYTERPWIRDQVNEAVGDLGNFMRS